MPGYWRSQPATVRDVVLNRRILIVNLPTLENSDSTNAALGKLIVADLRNMMAQTLDASWRRCDRDYREQAHDSAQPVPGRIR